MNKNIKQKQYELKRLLWRQTCRDDYGMEIPEIAGRGKQHDNIKDTK